MFTINLQQRCKRCFNGVNMSYLSAFAVIFLRILLTVILTARLCLAQTAGSLDSTMVLEVGPAIGDEVSALAFEPDGKVLIGGRQFNNAGGDSKFGMVRIFRSGQEDLQFTPQLPGNSLVSAIIPTTDGKILIGGDLTGVNNFSRQGIARLNADGSPDITFNPIVVPAGDDSSRGVISSLSIDAEMNIVAGGNYVDVNGFRTPLLVRIFPDGSVDPSFETPEFGNFNLARILPFIDRVTLESDGKLIVGGYFNRVNGEIHSGIVRLNPNGSVDNRFSGNLHGSGEADTWVHSIVETEEGKILVAGPFSFPGTNGFIRLNYDGTIDGTFNAKGIPGAQISDVAIQGDGKILLGGVFTTVRDSLLQGVARLLNDGSIDPMFQPGLGANGPVRQIRLDTRGDLWIGGGFTRYNQVDIDGVAHVFGGQDAKPPTLTSISTNRVETSGQTIRLNVNVQSFAPPRYQWQHNGTNLPGRTTRAITLENLRIKDSGTYQVTIENDAGVARGSTTVAVTPPSIAPGSVDIGFNWNSGMDGSVRTLYLQGDGKILLGGDFTWPQRRLARAGRNGKIDYSFHPPAISGGPIYRTPGPALSDQTTIRSIAMQPDGRIIVGGAFTNIASALHRCLARIYADGSLDKNFMKGTGIEETAVTRPNNLISGELAIVESVQVRPDKTILIAGSFNKVNGVTRPGLARLDPDGSLDTNFLPRAQGGGYIAIQLGKILSGKIPTRFLSDGSRDETFNPEIPTGAAVSRAVVESDDRIVYVALVDRNSGATILSRLLPDGTHDPSFQSATFNGPVADLALQASGMIIAVGAFTNVNGQATSNSIRLSADGRLNMDLHLSLSALYAPALDCVLALPDSRVMIGGRFSTLDEFTRSNVGRLNGDLVFFNFGLSGSSFSIEFATSPDRAYTVERSSQLGRDGWAPVFNTLSEDTTVRFMNSTDRPQQFYRIISR